MKAIALLILCGNLQQYDLTFRDGTEVHLEYDESRGELHRGTKLFDPQGVFRIPAHGIDYQGELWVSKHHQLDVDGSVMGVSANYRTPTVRLSAGMNRWDDDVLPRPLNNPVIYNERSFLLQIDGQFVTRHIYAPDWPVGDVTGDRLFTSEDIFQILAYGYYETGWPAVWLHGDWTQDGVFNFDDILAALEVGTYEQPQAAIVPEPDALVGLWLLTLAFLFAWDIRPIQRAL